jgi:hypothetical protein
MMRRLLVVLLVAPCFSMMNGGALHAQRDADNVVLVTLDGARTEEVFGGLDLDVLKSTLGGAN